MELIQPNHSDRGHAEFSPSSLKYVAGCAGYQGREGTSEAAEKGTRIHEALEVRDPSALHDEEEVEIYDKIVEDEDDFLNTVIGDLEREEFNEVVVDVSLDGTSTWGTCDRFTIYGEKKDRAVMGDYKTGVSVIDTPDKNWQAKAYATGAFQNYPEVNIITFVFYIPVRNEVLWHEFTRDDLPELIDELSKVIKRGESIRPKWEDGAPSLEELNPNINCRFCAHEDHCPALGGLAIEVASRVADNALPKGDIADPEDPETLELLWVVAKVVGNWASRIRSKAIAKAKEGAEFPSLKLKSMGTPRKCNDNVKLLEVASEFDISEDEVLKLASFPLKKIADAVGSKAPKGEKMRKSKDFLDAAENNGIIDTSDERFTLS